MRYTSDMSEKQWEMIRRLLKQKGYRSIEKRREQINAVLYLVKTGCQWRNLPKDFPKAERITYYRKKAALLTYDATLPLILYQIMFNIFFIHAFSEKLYLKIRTSSISTQDLTTFSN